MNAWIARKHGPFVECLAWETQPEPALEPGDALIDVRAAGINFSDILRIAGKDQTNLRPPFMPGMEAAGIVVEAGDNCAFSPGDRVVTTHGSGAWAERTVARAGQSYRIPDNMSFSDAASFTVNYETSYIALMRRGRLRAGEVVLIHAGSSGVGTAAIQLAKSAGATVIATASAKKKLDVCAECGAQHVIDYKNDDFVEAIQDITAGTGVDIVYDPVGGDVFEKSLQCINFEGRILVIGFASGKVPKVASNRLMRNNADVIGVDLGGYNKREPNYIFEVIHHLFSVYNDGLIKPVIYQEFPFEDVVKALKAIQSRKSWGKLVLVRE